MKLNKQTREFYLEIDDIVNGTSLTEADLSEKFGEAYQQVIERDISRYINRYLFTIYTGKNQKANELMLQYRLLTDPRAREGLKRAMIEHAQGAFYSGMDLNLYHEELKHSTPTSVVLELNKAELYSPGEINIFGPAVVKLREKVDQLIGAF